MTGRSALEIAGGVEIEEPQRGREAGRTGNVTRLDKDLDGKDRNGLCKAARGCLKRGEAARSSSAKFLFKDRQGLATNHGRKWLGNAVDRREGHGSARGAGVPEQINDERGGARYRAQQDGG